ncbi:hypothetical protein TWF225_010612 [Orbilia oligospora]|nr:hypothetical protein TWF225_010612 [Orbilia oligospora]KAF3250947.1 hypothetical protein TWF128_007375 [Orbilia oligospora]
MGYCDTRCRVLDSSGGPLQMTRKMYTAAQCKACLRIRGIHASDVYTRKYEAVNVFYRCLSPVNLKRVYVSEFPHVQLPTYRTYFIHNNIVLSSR